MTRKQFEQKLVNYQDMKKTLNEVLEQSIRQNWELLALSNYEGENYTYADVANRIARYHLAWQHAGLQPGFRVALCGRNSAEWCIGLIAAFTYGAVAVPLLNEFTPEMIIRLVKHSEAQVLLVGPQVFKSIEPLSLDREIPGLEVSQLDEQNMVDDLFQAAYPQGLTPELIHFNPHKPEDLLMINYTSGTTSEPKGVMIPERAMWSNMAFAEEVLPNLGRGMKVLSMLPTAHLYGMSFELMYEFVVGIHVTLLNRALSPAVILKALKDVRPHLVVVVPMLIEKIVRKGIMPEYNSAKIKAMRRIPGMRQYINGKFRDGLMQALGGRIYEVIIGGAALNSEVEQLLTEIKFPFTVGYGMTECAPIIGYSDWKEFIPQSCGKPAPRMEVRIDSTDPARVPGEIVTRGMNVMLGYYKNEEATRRAIDADGWLHTGDMGVMDSVGNIFIRGRIKNMLLSPSGQNVYPEEIEAVVNSQPYVVESVVVQREHRLVALVYPDRQVAQSAGLHTDEDILKFLNSRRNQVNRSFPVYAQVNAFELVEKEFEKTPKKSIKRFLYT